MGWARCGEDSRGRPIGYAHQATCDEPGCAARIHRGLAYACGGEHGEDVHSCEGYFCGAHLSYCEVSDLMVCGRCRSANAGRDAQGNVL